MASLFFTLLVLQQEYVLQADGSITPLSSTQNFVLSEKQAGEILAQVRRASKQNDKTSRVADSDGALTFSEALVLVLAAT